MIDITKFDGHTAGPWKAVSGNKGREFNSMSIRPKSPAVKGMQLPLAHVGRWLFDRDDPVAAEIGDSEANARLIAAAPDLLAEVIRLRTEVAALKGGEA